MSGYTSEAVLMLGQDGDGDGPGQTLDGTVEYLINQAATTVGSVALPGTSVSIVQDGQVLATPTSDADGNFTANVATPSPSSPVSAYALVGGSYVSSANVVLQPPVQAIAATDAAGTLTDRVDTDFPNSPNALSVAPFQQVAITDPTPGALLSATVAVSGPVAANLTLPPLQNLSAAGLAAALDAARLQFTGFIGGADTVTANITDNAGHSGQLISTDNLVYYSSDGSPDTTLPFVALTSSAETSATAMQTITGSAKDLVFADLGQQVSDAPSPGAMVTLLDNGSVLGQAATDANGDFSANVALPFSGTNSLTATVTDSFGTGSSTVPVIDTVLPASGTQTLGSGPDTLALLTSERGQPAGAQFVLDVNGQQVGGVQTTAADFTAGQTQEFDLLGDYSAATNDVSITYLNASNSLLLLDSAALDGTALPGSSLVLSNDGTESLSFAGSSLTPPGTTTIGSGPDALTLDLSQRAEPAGAQFTVAVDGTQIGGTQTVTANSAAGQTEELDVLGNFAPGSSHTATITYLNANNSLLLLDQAAINGSTIAGGSAVFSNNGSLGFSFAAPAPVTPSAASDAVALPDTLGLSVSALGSTAEFAVSVDGSQVGGVQTVSALQGNGPPQVFDVLGSFAGSHTVSVAAVGGSALAFGAATLDGAAVANSAFTVAAGTTSSFAITH